MGFLKRFFKSSAVVQQLPMGSITVDRDGTVVASTISSTYPKALLQQIANSVITILKQAREAQVPLAEVSIHFASLRITARELRGGAIIFLLPQTALMPAQN